MHISKLINLDTKNNASKTLNIPKGIKRNDNKGTSDPDKHNTSKEYIGTKEKGSTYEKASKSNNKARSATNNKNAADFSTFQMKLYGNEGDKLEELARIANTDKTAFVKQRVFSDEGIIILDKANYISRSLIEISDYLRCTKHEEGISNELLQNTFSKLCEIADSFISISKELTEFKNVSDNEGNSNVHS